jgi:hypothetical protein
VQGAFAEHEALLRELGVGVVSVRLPEHVRGLAGLVLVLLGDFAALVLGIGIPASEAFFDAARVVATVGPAAPPAKSTTSWT